VTTYAVIGHELLMGRALYSDLWDHKPPAVHALFAVGAAVAGYGPEAVLLVNVFAALVTLLGVFAATSVASGRRDVGLVAAALWTVLGADLGLQANQPNTEVFINACLVWAIALVLSRRGGARRWSAAPLFALASLFKPIAAVAAVCVGLAHVLVPHEAPGARRQAIRDVVVWGLVGVAAWFGVAGLFAAAGDLQPFEEAVFTYNRAYAGSPVANVVRGLRPSRLLPTYLRPALGLITVAVLGLVAGARSFRRAWVVIGGWALGTALAVALPGYFWPHYYQLWLPVIAVGAGLAMASILERFEETRPRVMAYAGVALVAVTAMPQLPLYRMGADDWSRAKYGDEFIRMRDAARHLEEILKPDESFYNLGAETGLYLYTRRSPPAGLFYHYPMEKGPLAEALARRVVADLDRTRPIAIVVSSNVALPAEHVVRRLVDERYVAVSSVLDELRFQLRVLPGSALARRLDGASYGDSSPHE